MNRKDKSQTKPQAPGRQSYLYFKRGRLRQRCVFVPTALQTILSTTRVLKNCQLIQWTAASEEMLQMTSIGYESGQAPLSCRHTSYSGTWATSTKNEEPLQSPPKTSVTNGHHGPAQAPQKPLTRMFPDGVNLTRQSRASFLNGDWPTFLPAQHQIWASGSLRALALVLLYIEGK